jgi:hypothetical protein
LQNLLGGQGGEGGGNNLLNQILQQPGGTLQIPNPQGGNPLTLPLSSLSQLLSSGGGGLINQTANPTMTQQANPTINVNAAKPQPYVRFATSFNPGTAPTLTPRTQQMVPL